MKKFINAVDDVLTESLDGFAAAHADILALGGGHKFVRRKDAQAGQGGADLGRRLGPRAAAWRASSATACSTPPVPARSSPRRRPTR